MNLIEYNKLVEGRDQIIIGDLLAEEDCGAPCKNWDSMITAVCCCNCTLRGKEGCTRERKNRMLQCLVFVCPAMYFKETEWSLLNKGEKEND